MDSSRLEICCIMALLGPIQVLWALAHGAVTNLPKVREHFGHYLAGVGFYFLMLIVLGFQKGSDMNVYYDFHFFGGAFGLAIYHVYIVLLSIVSGLKQYGDAHPDPKEDKDKLSNITETFI